MSKPPQVRRWAGNGALRICYDHFNETYWDGKLIQPEKIAFVKGLENDGHTSWRSSGTVWVSVHDDFRRHFDVGAIVLLHEMAHIAMGYDYQGDHGIRYHAELHRLFLAGAYDKLI